MSNPKLEKRMYNPALKASVIISTKDRRNDLRRALGSVITQTVPIEVLVIDDGSSDETSEMVRSEFPSVKLFRSDKSMGLQYQRNRLAELAASPILVSLDDDAEFASSDTISQILPYFSSEFVGAVAIPRIEMNFGSRLMDSVPDDTNDYVTAYYTGCGHAIRRDLFLGLGGYSPYLQYYCSEERDICLRMLNHGYIVIVAHSMPFRHYQSSSDRNWSRIRTYAAHNNVVFCWQNIPMPFLFIQLPGSVYHLCKYGLVHRCLMPYIRGTGMGLVACSANWHIRCPVALETHSLFRYLERKGPLELNRIKSSLERIRLHAHDI